MDGVVLPDFSPVTLAGRHVRLEPLEAGHADTLWMIAGDPAIWRWYPMRMENIVDMRHWVDTALDEQRRGQSLPFVQRDVATGALVGSTRFGNIAREHRRAEIGWTWLASPAQRTAVNTEAKLLLLRHAFETLRLNRVELKTDALNERSRQAIARIGAQQEGIFRKHMVTHTGRLRDTVYFSITHEEWPAVQRRLSGFLAGA